MNEYDLIRQISEDFSRSPEQANALFECDSELVRIGSGLWALTLDDFSPEEDLFTHDDPERLGWNLAVATLSDLFAAGAVPRFFMQALSLSSDLPNEFAEEISRGICSVLDQAGCFLVGGDFGRCDDWRFCGFAAGPVPGKDPLTRNLPDCPCGLWITGELGDANLAIATQASFPRFELRMKEAEWIRENAVSCIDTSGGFMDSIWQLHLRNPAIGMSIEMDALPLAPGVSAYTEETDIPKEAALLGGAGEYELLFAVPSGNIGDDCQLPGDLCATKIGCAKPDSEGLVRLKSKRGSGAVLDRPPPCARSVGTYDEHMLEVIRMAEEIMEQG